MNAAFCCLSLLASSPVARVGSFEIDSKDLEARIEETRRAGGRADPDALLEDLVNEALMAKEGERLGLTRSPAVRAIVQTKQRELAAEQLLDAETDKLAVLDPGMLRELYHQTADAVRLELLMVADEEDARAAFGRLEKGGKFADEARRSLDPSSAEGVVERLRAQLEPQFAEAAFQAPVGQWIGPHSLGVGFVVYRVSQKTIGDEAGFRAKEKEIRAFARQQLRAEYRRHLVEQLRKTISVDESFVRSLGARMDVTPEEAGRVLASAEGRSIVLGEVLAEVQRKFGGQLSGHLSGPAVKLESLWAKVDVELLGAEAVKRGHGSDPATLAATRVVERDATVRALAAQLRRSARNPTESELEEWYDANKKALVFPTRRSCMLVVLADEASATLARRQVEGGRSLEALAKQTGVKSQIGSVPEDNIEAMAIGGQAALAAAMRRPGVLSQPVASPGGWTLVQCGEKTPAGSPSFEEARTMATAAVSERVQQEAIRQRCRELRAQASITLDPGAARRPRP